VAFWLPANRCEWLLHAFTIHEQSTFTSRFETPRGNLVAGMQVVGIGTFANPL